MTLEDTAIGQSVSVTEVGGEGALRQHLLDMGIIPGTVATLKKYAPTGDPMQIDCMAMHSRSGATTQER